MEIESVNQEQTSLYEYTGLEEEFHSVYQVKEELGHVMPTELQSESFFNCTNCHYKTSSKGNLTKHIKALHEGVRYKCDHCSYSTGFSSTLARHKRTLHIH